MRGLLVTERRKPASVNASVIARNGRCQKVNSEPYADFSIAGSLLVDQPLVPPC